MNRRILAMAMGLLVLSVCLLGCGKEAPAEPAETQQTTVAATEAPTTMPTLPPGPPHSIAVETEYGNLYYQDQWQEFMKTEVTGDGENIVVRFYGSVNETRYPLFDFIISSKDGESVGVLTDVWGTERNVFIEVHELEDISGLEKTHQDRLYAMREDLNFIMENLM